MEPDGVRLYRWVMPVPRQPLPATLRLLERIVIEEAAPVVRDPVVQERAAAYWLGKETGAPDGVSDLGVSLTVVAPPESEAAVTGAIERHVTSGSVPPRATPPELILHPLAAAYRQGLREVTDIALDLHDRSESQLRHHQCTLIRLACSPSDPRFELHAHLKEYSPAYAVLADTTGQPTDFWKHEEFWSRLFTPGPAVDLSPPLQWLWNIVIGVTPRRWNDPEVVAASLGIQCS